MKKVASIALIAVLALALVACGGGGAGDNVAGTYKMTSMSMGGTTIDVKQIAQLAGMSDDIFRLELNEDSSFVLTIYDGTGDTTMEGTWKASGSTLTLTMEGSDLKCKLEGKKITISEEGMEMVFEK